MTGGFYKREELLLLLGRGLLLRRLLSLAGLLRSGALRLGFLHHHKAPLVASGTPGPSGMVPLLNQRW